MKNNTFIENINCDVLKQLQSVQDLLHWLRLGFLGHGTDSNNNLLCIILHTEIVLVKLMLS